MGVLKRLSLPSTSTCICKKFTTYLWKSSMKKSVKSLLNYYLLLLRYQDDLMKWTFTQDADFMYFSGLVK